VWSRLTLDTQRKQSNVTQSSMRMPVEHVTLVITRGRETKLVGTRGRRLTVPR
jgi:hypothetical protein